MKHLLIYFILILGLTQAVQAQEGYELGGWVGLSHYFGDLNTNSSFSSPGLAAGLAARHNFNTRVSFTLGFGFGQVSAADSTSTNSYQLQRNLSFKSNVYDFSAMLEFNFFEYFHGSYDQFYTPYIFGGLAVSKYNPKAYYEGEWHALRELGTEGQTQGNEYVLATLALAYGAGVKFDINKDWSINVALSGRKLMSDYLDDVSTVYPDVNNLQGTRGPLAVALSDRSLNGDFATEGFQRGNIRDKDYYYFLSIGVMRYFGDIKCPKISIIKP